MSSQTGVTVAVIGASGNVGRKIVELLVQRGIVAPDNLKLYASKKSAGKKIKLADREWTINDIDNIDFTNTQLALFATESSVSKIYIPKALKEGTVVVDSSSLHRLDASVPLIVSPVNKHLVSINHARLYAIANCISSPISTVIAPLHRAHKINRVIVSTYQSASGAGRSAMDELEGEMHAILNKSIYERKIFQRQIAFNIIPQIDTIMEDGFTYEEFKIMREIQKIVGGQFNVTATSVRVPVMVGHSVSLGVEFEKEVSVNDVRNILKKSQGVVLADDYKTPVEVVGSDQVFVGRLRKDPSVTGGVQMWLCSDNLLRGAATDMVEVAEELVCQIAKKAT